MLVGKWSDAPAVALKLAELGVEVSAAALTDVLERCRRAGLARGRPLTDAELLEIAAAAAASEP